MISEVKTKTCKCGIKTNSTDGVCGVCKCNYVKCCSVKNEETTTLFYKKEKSEADYKIKTEVA